MNDVFTWLQGDVLEEHRKRSLRDDAYGKVMRSLGDYRLEYNDTDPPDIDDPIRNGYVEYNGEMVCWECLYSWVFEFGAVEPANYVQYTGYCHMVCSQCDTTIQPWKDK